MPILGLLLTIPSFLVKSSLAKPYHNVTDEEKANLFNEYFFSVYSHRSSYPSIPPTSTIPSLSVIDVSPSDVYSALSGLDPSKTKGVDGIGPQILKYCALALYEWTFT